MKLPKMPRRAINLSISALVLVAALGMQGCSLFGRDYSTQDLIAAYSDGLSEGLTLEQSPDQWVSQYRDFFRSDPSRDLLEADMVEPATCRDIGYYSLANLYGPPVGSIFSGPQQLSSVMGGTRVLVRDGWHTGDVLFLTFDSGGAAEKALTGLKGNLQECSTFLFKRGSSGETSIQVEEVSAPVQDARALSIELNGDLYVHGLEGVSVDIVVYGNDMVIQIWNRYRDEDGQAWEQAWKQNLVNLDTGLKK